MLALLFLALATAEVHGQPTPDAVGEVVRAITSDDADRRYRARFEAEALGAPAVAPIGELLVRVQRGEIDDANLAREIDVTARAALARIVHHAGRPGANDERPPVVAELARFLVDGTPDVVRREVLHLIAFIGGDEAVPHVARLLDAEDRHLREQARLALEEIPGSAAAGALVRAAHEGRPEERASCIFSLGKKDDRSSVPFLLETAGGGDEALRFAALEALAHLGEKQAVAVFERVLASEPADLAPIINEYLRLADRLAAAEPREAEPLYRRALASSPAEHQRERALLRLAREDSVASLPFLLDALADDSDRVRDAAVRRLAEIRSPEIDARLADLYREASPEARASLLAVLASRDREAAQGFLAEAAASSNDDLKVVALDLLGRLDDPALAPLLERVAEEGSARVRPLAVRGQLLVAEKLLAANEPERALASYLQVLKLAADDAQRRSALAGIERIGDASALPAVVPLTKHPGCGTEATSALIALAAKLGATGEVDEAAEMLTGVAGGQYSRDLRSRASAALVALGRDPRDQARRQGFVVDWWCVGPISSGDGEGLATEYFAERVIDLENIQRIGARRFQWQRLDVPSLDGVIDLVPLFRRTTNRIAYAHTEIASASDAEVLLKMGSDDGMACWVNGERVHFRPGTRGLTVDGDVVPARLVKGKNRILLKIENGDGDWAFCLRITDRDGKPYPFEPALE